MLPYALPLRTGGKANWIHAGSTPVGSTNKGGYMFKTKFKSRIVEFPANGKTPYKVRETGAEIFDGDELISKGSVRQFSGDKDTPVIGQKRALADALKTAGLERKERLSIWKEFFERSKSAQKLLS